MRAAVRAEVHARQCACMRTVVLRGKGANGATQLLGLPPYRRAPVYEEVPVPMRAPKLEVAPVQSHLSAGQMGAARPSTRRPQLSTHLG